MNIGFLTKAFDQIKEALRAASFDSWYGYIIIFASALASEFLYSFVSQFIHRFRNKDQFRASVMQRMREDNLWPDNYEIPRYNQWRNVKLLFMSAGNGAKHERKRQWKRILREEWARFENQKRFSLMEIPLYFFGYLLFLSIAVVFYALAHNSAYHTDIVKVFRNSFVALWEKNKIDMVAVPIVITLARRIDNRLSQRIRVFAIAFLVFALVMSPLLVTYPSQHTGLEPLLLSEFKGRPYPFVTRFYDPKGLAGYIINGYVGEDDNGKLNGGQESQDEALEIPTEDPEGMAFVPLMRAASISARLGETERQKMYVDAAYALYEKKQAVDEAGNPAWHEIGLMWFYKGSLDKNAEFYYQAGIAYESAEDHGNALICFIPAYLGNPNDVYAEKAIKAFINQDAEDVSKQYTNFLMQLQAQHKGSIPFMDEMRQKYPDNLAIQLVAIMRDIQEGRFSQGDVEIVRRFLADEKYYWCPKLAIIEAYWGIGKNVDYKEIYKRYLEYEWIFEPEDKVNLAWMLYMSGEYSKAYSVAATATEEQDGNNRLIPDAYFFAAEICMQDPMLNIDESRLLERMPGKTNLLWYDENSRIRINIIGVLLSNRIGKSVDFEILASNLKSIFDGASFSERMILATADYECGNNQSCVMRCREIQASGDFDGNEHRLLFLKADALMAYANEVEDQQTRIKLLQEAETDMESIRRTVEDDYIEWLQKLSAIYDCMEDRQNDKIKVDSILEALPVKERR